MPIKIHKIIRSRRRSMSLEITRDARLVVRIPRYASLRDVKRFITEKRDWIEKKLHEACEIYRKKAPKRFISGEEFFYLGEKYRLLITEIPNSKLKFQNGFYLSERGRIKAKKLFINWYKKQAKLNIPKRVRWYAVMHHLKYDKIKITSASRRWGSCTSKNNLNFTWKLILLPIKIVDYVVAHELAHLVQHNHSKRFWAEVEKMIPDYKEKRKWLKQHGDEYTL